MNARGLNQMKRRWLNVGHYAVLGMLSFLCLAPLLVMFMTSLKTQTQIFSDAPVWLFVPTLDNYREVLFESSFDKYLVNSLIVSVVSTVLTLLFGCMTAYAIVRFRFIGRSAVAWTTLLLRTVPLAVLAVPVFALWTDWGLGGSLSGLILLFLGVALLCFAKLRRSTRSFDGVFAGSLAELQEDLRQLKAASDHGKDPR